MATVEDLADLLTDEEVDAIEFVVQSRTMKKLRTDGLSDQEKIAVKLVDRMIAESPALSQPITIFRSFENGSALHTVSEVTERAFLTGSKLLGATGKNVVTMSITVPAGTKVLELPNGGYILNRGISLTLKDGAGEMVDATFKKGSGKEALQAKVIGLAPSNKGPLEFHLAGQHNQSDHGKGGGGGKNKKSYSGSDDPKLLKDVDDFLKKNPSGSIYKATKRATPAGEESKPQSRLEVLEAREKRLQAREARLQKAHKLEKKSERRRSRQQVVNTLMGAGAVVAGVVTIAGLLQQSGLTRN